MYKQESDFLITPDFFNNKWLIVCWNLAYNQLFYRNFLMITLSDTINLLVICREEKDILEIKKNLDQYLIPHENISFIVYEFISVWIRDYCPLIVRKNKDKCNYLINYQYNKWEKRGNDNLFGEYISNYLRLSLRDLDLVLAGGNLTVNSQGVAICTDLLLKENKNDQKKIENNLKKHLGINKLVIIKQLKEEHTGHIDILMKFISDQILLVSKLPKSFKDYTLMKENIELVKKQLPNIQIIEIPLAPDNGSYSNMGNLFYSYINSVILNETILIPLFGEFPTDQIALKTYTELFPNYKVEGIFCKDLVQLKGALHCITAQV